MPSVLPLRLPLRPALTDNSRCPITTRVTSYVTFIKRGVGTTDHVKLFLRLFKHYRLKVAYQLRGIVVYVLKIKKIWTKNDISRRHRRHRGHRRRRQVII